MIEDKNIDKLILSHLFGKTEPWEVQELLDWINDSAENKLKFQLVKKYWENSYQKIEIDQAELDAAFNNTLHKHAKDYDDIASGSKNAKVRSIETVPKHSFNKRYLSIAASVAILVGLVFTTLKYSNKINLDRVEEQTIVKSNPNGKKTNFQLPDGSEVWLNSGSELSFEGSFPGDERIVLLKGEAYFKVRKDATRPFKVLTDNFSVEALGTSFNVRSYDDNPHHSIALLTGKVAVEHFDRPGATHLLTPGMGLEFDADSHGFKSYAFDPHDVVAWKEGILIFRETGFYEVISSLEKWYGISISVQGKPPSDFAVSGKFKNEYLNNVLNNLQYGRAFDYSIDGKKVSIIFN